MSRYLYLLLLASSLVFCIQCGGGGSTLSQGGISGSGGPVISSGGISGSGGSTTISGTIEDLPSNLSKSRFADSNLSITATQLDGAQSFSISLSEFQYQVTVPQNTNFKITVSIGETPLLSRSFSSKDTSTDQLTANLNTATHAISSMTTAYQSTHSSTWPSALSAVETEVTGLSTPKESDLTLDNIISNDQDFAFHISIYQTLLQSLDTQNLQLIVLLNTPMQSSSRSDAKSAITNTINQLSDTSLATSYSTTFDAVLTSVQFQNRSISISITNILITQRVTNPHAIPFTTSAADQLRLAAPGLLFQYTFQEADVLDSRGITSYSGSFSSTPAGIFSSTENGRTLQWIPSATDQDKTFTYTLTIKAGNGQSLQKSISIKVNRLLITPLRTIDLVFFNINQYQPILQPWLNNDKLYLVSQTASSQYRLEAYTLSSLTSSTGLDTIQISTFPTLFTPQQHSLSNQDTLFSSTSGDLITHFNTSQSFSTTTTSPGIHQLALVNDNLYSLNDSSSKIYKSTTKGLNDFFEDTTPSSKSQSITAQKIQAFGNHLTLSTSNKVSIYDPQTQAFYSDWDSSNPILDSSSSATVQVSPFYIYHQNKITSLSISNSSLTTTDYNFTPSDTLSKMSNLGSLAFASIGNFSIAALDLQPSSSTINLASYHDPNFIFTNAKHLAPVVYPIEKGINTDKSGAYLFVLGQKNTATSATDKNSWQLRVYTMEPQK